MLVATIRYWGRWPSRTRLLPESAHAVSSAFSCLRSQVVSAPVPSSLCLNFACRTPWPGQGVSLAG